MNGTSDLTLTLLRKGLDALSARQTTISNNIANVETPNYKAATVSFEESLQRVIVPGEPAQRLTRTDSEHLNPQGKREERLENLEYSVSRRNTTSIRKDGNNVDIENEMLDLAETALRYQSMSTLASKKLALMRMVAQETR